MIQYRHREEMETSQSSKEGGDTDDRKSELSGSDFGSDGWIGSKHKHQFK